MNDPYDTSSEDAEEGIDDKSNDSQLFPSTEDWVANHSQLEPVDQLSEPLVNDNSDGSEQAPWKDELRRRLESWMEEIETMPEAELEPEAEEKPDLYTAFESLAVLSSESRKSNRRTAEAFSQWNDVLTQFQGKLDDLDRRYGQCAESEESQASRNHALMLVEISDRVERMGEAFRTAPGGKWTFGQSHWIKAWESQGRGMDILKEHLLDYLKTEGVQRLQVKGSPFDPSCMNAVSVESSSNHPHNTVIEEMSPGYRLGNDLLRAAQVKIAVREQTEEI